MNENPLSGRVCAFRLDNVRNECIQQKCSCYEKCYRNILTASREIDALHRKPAKHHHQPRYREDCE